MRTALLSVSDRSLIVILKVLSALFILNMLNLYFLENSSPGDKAINLNKSYLAPKSWETIYGDSACVNLSCQSS